MKVGLIWAQTLEGVIGAGNAIPWHLPEDMANFKATTLGWPVVMGRRTWDSLPPRFRPLPGRRNLVVTRSPGWVGEGAERAASVAEALELAAAAAPASAETWVIGGGEIYRAALGFATMLSITEIDAVLEGDTYAPSLDSAWKVVDDGGWQLSKTGLRFRIRRYTR